MAAARLTECPGFCRAQKAFRLKITKVDADRLETLSDISGLGRTFKQL